MNPKTSSELILDIDGISKTFGGAENGSTVIKDVTIKVHKGEFIAVIGKNGSGKTTLLKMIAGIIKPTKGKISIYSSMLAITDLGSGIVPDCTGYENIGMIGALYGVKGEDLNSMIQSVEEFSELGGKLDMPVKHFSQGMYLRLAFSILVFLKLDLIVFDEVLAVGDISFRKKCLDYISTISKSGCTVVYVTHSFEEISDYCTRCILLENGIIKMDGDPKLVYNTYVSESTKTPPRLALGHDDFRYMGDELRVDCVRIKTEHSYSNEIPFNESFEIEINWEKLVDDCGVTITIFIHDMFGRNIFSTCDTYTADRDEIARRSRLGKDRYVDHFSIPGYFLNVGDFSMHMSASTFKDINSFTMVAITNVSLAFRILANEKVEKDFPWKYSHSPIRMAVNFQRHKLAD